MFMWVFLFNLFWNLNPVLSDSFPLGPPLTHFVQMDSFGAFYLAWTAKEEEIILEVQVKTRGYVGLGFSPTGGMKGADIYIGWVDNRGDVYMTDRHSSGERTPPIDNSQDHRLIGGFANDTHTVIRFARPWISCDILHDFTLSEDTVRVIWAYDASVPNSTDSTMKYHDHRGTKSLYLKEPPIHKPLDLANSISWDVRAPEVRIPASLKTLYWCKLFKIPDLVTKHHFIGYVPLLDTHEQPVVHHIILYECSLPESAKHLQKWTSRAGAQCYSKNMPLSWSACGTPLVTWAVGSEGEMMPEHVGFPVGEDHGGSTYFMLEVHYDNPWKKDIVDTSGLRLYLTDRPRAYDAGVLTLGHKVEPSMIIPPGMEWITNGHCTADCTSKGLPPEGIKIFSGVLHSHLLGKSIVLQHIRNHKELEPMLKDEFYDFNYQQARVFSKEKTILPGDHLITSCTYDSTRKKEPTFGGFSTTDEMCLVFLSYYPKVKLADCYSRPELSLLFDIFGIKNLYENDKIMKMFSADGFDSSYIDPEKEHKLWTSSSRDYKADNMLDNFRLVDSFRIVNISEPPALQGKTFYDLLTSNSTWKDESIISNLKLALLKLPYEAKCLLHGRISLSEVPRKVKVPHYMPFQPEEKQCQSKNSQNIKEDDHVKQKWPEPPLQSEYFPSLFGQPRRTHGFEDNSLNGPSAVTPSFKPSIKEEAANVKKKFSGQGRERSNPSSVENVEKSAATIIISSSWLWTIMPFYLCLHI